MPGYSLTSNSSYNIQNTAQNDPEMRSQSTQDPPVEVVIPEVYSSDDTYGSTGPFSGIWSRKLRVRITGLDGSEKLDIRIPVSHLFSSIESYIVIASRKT